MRIISKSRLREFWEEHPHARAPLESWHHISKDATWRNFMEVRQCFGTVDTARVTSGHTVTIFDIGGNKYRLIAAIHYDRQTLYLLRVLSHAQYDTNQWKEEL
jgi:mRNA interferase HigB